MAAESQEAPPQKRVGLYVDGFNLYHAVSDLGQPWLKWCNLRRLGEILIPSRTHVLTRAVICTAFYPGDDKKKFRHQAYLDALAIMGVDSVLGHYVHEDMDCRECDHKWKKPTEKESDINLALSLYDDASRNVIDEAFLLTADSDQAATARLFRHRFADKRFVSVSPPGRQHSSHILKYVETKADKIAVNEDHLERSMMRGFVTPANGGRAIRRPREYDPPRDYVYWDDRPQKAGKAHSKDAA